ncbi:MAG: hypothetical protein KC451_14500, partial [Amylibacter sp.]|nr:hypothetical protein [Amylibacter sp.]
NGVALLLSKTCRLTRFLYWGLGRNLGGIRRLLRRLSLCVFEKMIARTTKLKMKKTTTSTKNPF